MNLMTVELTDSQFKKVSRIIYRLCGISLKDGKEALVRARLMKRLRALKMDNFDQYIRFIESPEGRNELGYMVDVMTTNKTSFFREQEHFSYLSNNILPNLRTNRLRFWTAACSSGEEAYSLAIILRERMLDIDQRDVKILATDISARMLEHARQAIYGVDAIKGIPKHILKRYFTQVHYQGTIGYKVTDNIRNMVKVARLNLVDNWPMKGKFDVVFCRNVMIYFDRDTQEQLINRFWHIIHTGGYLFVGHSEGLSAISHNFRYVRPAVYKK